MKLLVTLIAALSILGGGFTFIMAKSAIHEILAAILILCFVVSAVGLAMLEHLKKIETALGKRQVVALPAPDRSVADPGSLGPVHKPRNKAEADEAWRRAQAGE